MNGERNATTHSVILAPFNSTISERFNILETFKELLMSKKVIKFAPKVREIDR